MSQRWRLSNAEGYAKDIARRLKDSKHFYKDGDLRRCFITAPLLKNIWGPMSTTNLFVHARWTREEHEKVKDNFAKVVSILIEIEWPRLIEDFESLFFNVPKRTDAALPFSMKDLEFLDQDSRKAFFATQYTYIPFVIEQQGIEEDLLDQIILPFEADPQEIGQGQGSSGKVYKVTIPSGCLIWRVADRSDVNSESRDLAFKQLHRKDGYRRELDSLKTISRSLKHHENITRYTQAVFQGDQLRIFFPFAEHGSLKDLFERPHEKKFSYTKENLISALQHMVDGVAHLHADVFVPGDKKGSFKYGAHLDLKPANVLVFPNDKKELGVGTWKITDFGISSFKDVEDRIPLRGPEALGSSSTGAPGTSSVRRAGMTGPRLQMGEFSAPELHSSMKVPFLGYPVDMWSIGCMLSAVVCFALDHGVGWGGIERFRSNRSRGTDNDYYFEVLDDDQTCHFKLKDAVPEFLGKLLTDYPKERLWVKQCLGIISGMLHIEPKDRLKAESVSKQLASIEFPQDELNPLANWTDTVPWDTGNSGRPRAHSIAQSRKLRPQETIDHDPRASTDLSKSHAVLPSQMAQVTHKDSRDEHEAFLGNESSKSSRGLPAEIEGTLPAFIELDSPQIMHTPSTHPSAASDFADQNTEAGLVHSADHMFPVINIYNPQVYVPYVVSERIHWWLDSNESRLLWVRAPPLAPGWETNRAQVWANALRVKVSSSAFPLLCYCVKNRGSAIAEPALEIARTLNSQMVQYEIERLTAQSSYAAHNLEDALRNLRRHLAYLSNSVRAPIFCIIHGLEELDIKTRQGLQSFLRVLLDARAVCRLKILFTTNGNCEVLEELESVRRTPLSHIHDDWALSHLLMPSY